MIASGPSVFGHLAVAYVIITLLVAPMVAAMRKGRRRR